MTSMPLDFSSVAAATGSPSETVTSILRPAASAAAWKASPCTLPDAVGFSAMPTLAPSGKRSWISETRNLASLAARGRKVVVHGKSSTLTNSADDELG